MSRTGQTLPSFFSARPVRSTVLLIYRNPYRRAVGLQDQILFQQRWLPNLPLRMDLTKVHRKIERYSRIRYPTVFISLVESNCRDNNDTWKSSKRTEDDQPTLRNIREVSTIPSLSSLFQSLSVISRYRKGAGDNGTEQIRLECHGQSST